MINSSNFIYTNKGIMPIVDLYNIYQQSLLDNTITLPDLLSYDKDEFKYKFITPTKINKTTENNYIDIYETKLSDVFSKRNITLNCSADTELLQYNVIQTDLYPIVNKFIGVNNYLYNNRNKSKLNVQWKSISLLYNYATQMPCISLGDTVVKYISKSYRKKEIGYSITDNNDISLPVFCCMTNSTFYNFILIK